MLTLIYFLCLSLNPRTAIQPLLATWATVLCTYSDEWYLIALSLSKPTCEIQHACWQYKEHVACHDQSCLWFSRRSSPARRSTHHWPRWSTYLKPNRHLNQQILSYILLSVVQVKLVCIPHKHKVQYVKYSKCNIQCVINNKAPSTWQVWRYISQPLSFNRNF